jgi:hypothetical protein
MEFTIGSINTWEKNNTATSKSPNIRKHISTIEVVKQKTSPTMWYPPDMFAGL